MDVIDTHCHVISPDQAKFPRAPIGGKQSGWATTRPATAEDMLAGMDQAGIRQAVLVQATTAYGYDNSYILDCCRRWPERFIAVGTVDPLQPDAGASLPGSCGDGGLAGVRLFTSGSTVPTQGEWFAAPQAYDFWEAAGETGVTVCLQMRLGPATKQLISVLERFPAVRVLLDHMGYPDVAASTSRAAREMAELAQYPGLYLKLTHRTLEPLDAAGNGAIDFLDPVLSAFGAERIAWGSNYPAAEQPLPELLALGKRVLDTVPPAAREVIFAQTARRLYPSRQSGGH
jgi:predicted TIM-barrel fold metal-dependent hydrolase